MQGSLGVDVKCLKRGSCLLGKRDPVIRQISVYEIEEIVDFQSTDMQV